MSLKSEKAYDLSSNPITLSIMHLIVAHVLNHTGLVCTCTAAVLLRL